TSHHVGFAGGISKPSRLNFSILVWIQTIAEHLVQIMLIHISPGSFDPAPVANPQVLQECFGALSAPIIS
ncbi:glycoside hydrolase family 29 protein, partial [Moniliophthora roreri]